MQKSENINYIFGPVPSRRLGRSLGIDIVPFKTCSFDCIYCQLGRTTCKTMQRDNFINHDTVLKQLAKKLSTSEKNKPDIITLSGSGEPTLCRNLDKLIDGIKNITDIPVAVLTNSSLLMTEDVQQEICCADLVIPSLDAGDEKMFKHINRPVEELSFSEVAEGLISFRKNFKNKIWLEVFLIGGMNAVRADVEKIAEYVRLIKPDKIQLNTVARPPVEDYAFSVKKEVLQKLAKLFDPAAEIVAHFNTTEKEEYFSVTAEDIEALLKRRPCTARDISEGLNLHLNETVKYIEELLKNNRIRKTSETQAGTYYAA